MTLIHPTTAELLVSLEMLLLLYVPKKILDVATDKEIKAIKKYIYKHHNLYHITALRHCKEGACSKLKGNPMLPDQSFGQLVVIESELSVREDSQV